jgi:hypothetical protein
LSKAKRLAAAEAAVLRPGYVVANLDDFLASVAADIACRLQHHSGEGVAAADARRRNDDSAAHDGIGRGWRKI